MRALVYEGPETVNLRQFPDPQVKPGEVLLEVATAGICGSDIHGFLGHSERRQPGLVLGHETVARIAELGSAVTGWRLGQRVSFNPLVSCGACAACLSGRQNVCASWRLYGLDRLHGTYAEYVSVPAGQLYGLSEELPHKEAILVEPLAVVLRAFRLALAETPQSLVIVGAGPMGALSLVVARLRGVPRVAVSDVSEERLAVAKALGADLVSNASHPDAESELRSFTQGGAECVIEAVGLESTRRAAVRAAARGARIVFLGIASNDSSLPWIEMVRNEQAVFTSFAYAPRDFDAAVRLVEARRFDLTPWTESRPIEQGQEAFLTMAHRPGSTLKMMLEVKA